MELAIEFAKLVIPALLVLYAMYLTIHSFLKKDFEKRLLNLKVKNAEVVLPNRLQAYERMSLFLERISPNSIVIRLSNKEYSAREFQQVLINDIREEFNHNLSQQIYMSDELWQTIKSTVEEYISLINESVAELPADAKGIDLAKKLFDKMAERNYNQINLTLAALKEEIQKVF